MKAASLSSTLLARKGNAAPAGGFAMPPLPAPAAAEPTPRPVRAATSTLPVETAPNTLPLMPTQKADKVAKLTLRLDTERHLRLKLVAAHTRASIQELMVRALDAYLNELGPNAARGGCACLAKVELPAVHQARSVGRTKVQ